MWTYHNGIENIFKTGSEKKIENITILHNTVKKIRIMYIYCTQFKLEGVLHANQYFVASPLHLMAAFKRFKILLIKGSHFFLKSELSMCPSK